MKIPKGYTILSVVKIHVSPNVIICQNGMAEISLHLSNQNMKLAYYIVFYQKNIKENKNKIAELSSKTRDTTVTTFFGFIHVK